VISRGWAGNLQRGQQLEVVTASRMHSLQNWWLQLSEWGFSNNSKLQRWGWERWGSGNGSEPHVVHSAQSTYREANQEDDRFKGGPGERICRCVVEEWRSISG
jgi:hypothetical protein